MLAVVCTWTTGKKNEPARCVCGSKRKACPTLGQCHRDSKQAKFGCLLHKECEPVLKNGLGRVWKRRTLGTMAPSLVSAQDECRGPLLRWRRDKGRMTNRLTEMCECRPPGVEGVEWRK